MRSTLTLTILLYFILAIVRIEAAAPTKLADKARLDFMASDSVGALNDLRIVQGAGIVGRMDWIDPAQRPRSITAEFSIWPFGWRDFELRFTPENSGTVELALLGPWQQINGELAKQDVFWDELQVDGAALRDGGFEQLDGSSGGWTIQGGTIERGTPEAPAVAGRSMARTWHNGRIVTTLNVSAGKAVRLRGRARAVLPADLVTMKRIESRDTAAHVAARRFMRGINFGNYLEAPLGQNWGATYSAADFENAKQQGFDHVRIPVGWHNFTGPAPDYVLRPEIFRKADVLVDETLKRGMMALVNIHHFDDFTSNPTRERARFVAIWKQLSEHYAQRSDALAFELLNEPKDAATTEVMNSIYAECVREIRLKNSNRVIFIGPGLWNQADELPKLQLPDDDTNLIVTLHTYLPMNFTHQGASWSGPDYRLAGIRFPGPPEKPLPIPELLRPKASVVEWITQYNTLPEAENPSSRRAFAVSLDQAREWSEYYGRPIHIGEFGAIRNADSKSRTRYCHAIRQQLEPYKIGWGWWDWKADFRYWDVEANRPMPGMREGLFGELR